MRVSRRLHVAPLHLFERNKRMGAVAASAMLTDTGNARGDQESLVRCLRGKANVAHGPQQVNNGTAADSRPRANEIAPSRLVEAENGERLDI